MTDFINWIKANRAALVPIVLMLAVIGFGVGCSMFDPKVTVPANVQVVTGAAPRVPLSEANQLLGEYRIGVEAYAAGANQSMRDLGASIDEAAQFQANLRAIVWQGVDTAATSAQAIPGLGLILPSLTGLIALFVPRPGTQRRIDAAYDSGSQDTVKAINAVNATKPS